MAKSLQTEAYSVKDTIDLNNIDILFLGDGNYGGNCSAAMQDFIDHKLSGTSIKHIILFGTYGGLTNAMQKMRKRLEALHLPVVPEEFGTKGRAWLFINMFYPNKHTLTEAALFAKTIIKTYAQ